MSAVGAQYVSNIEVQSKTTAVTGLVKSCEQDENNEGATVAIVCGDEDKYMVHHTSPVVEDLTRNIDELVRAEGFLLLDEDTGEEFLAVESFEVLNEELEVEDPDWIEEDDEEDDEWKTWENAKKVEVIKPARQPKPVQPRPRKPDARRRRRQRDEERWEDL